MRRRERRAHVAVPAAGVAALAVLAAACSSGSSSSSHSRAADSTALQTVSINSTDTFRFDPSTVHVHVGTVQVTLTDRGSYPHNIKVGDLGFTSPTVSGNLGENRTTFTLTFAHAGTYGFVCTFHDTAGMKGRFVVS
jgi:plastocyanin